jgi:hypothetical protein
MSFAQGKVSFQPSGETEWSEATVNRPVTTGDRIYTDQDGRAELEVGPFSVRLSQATDVTLANLNDQLMQLGVGQGTLRVTIYELPANNSVEIDTPNGALILQSAGSYRVDAAADGNSTQVTVNAGTLQISAGDLSQTLQSGQAVRLTGTGPVAVRTWTLTGRGPRGLTTVQCGFPPMSPRAGFPIGMAIGFSLNRGVGRGLRQSRGAMRRSIMAAGPTSARFGPGFPDLSWCGLYTPPRWWHLSAVRALAWGSA